MRGLLCFVAFHVGYFRLYLLSSAVLVSLSPLVFVLPFAPSVFLSPDGIVFLSSPLAVFRLALSSFIRACVVFSLPPLVRSPILSSEFPFVVRLFLSFVVSPVPMFFPSCFHSPVLHSFLFIFLVSSFLLAHSVVPCSFSPSFLYLVLGQLMSCVLSFSQSCVVSPFPFLRCFTSVILSFFHTPCLVFVVCCFYPFLSRECAHTVNRFMICVTQPRTASRTCERVVFPEVI